MWYKPANPAALARVEGGAPRRGGCPWSAGGPSMRESGESPKVVRESRLSDELTTVIFF